MEIRFVTHDEDKRCASTLKAPWEAYRVERNLQCELNNGHFGVHRYSDIIATIEWRDEKPEDAE